jgi:chromosome segregation ATPase
MEDKLRHANQSKDSIMQRLQQEEKSRMEESLELCSLREEVSRLCESVLVEKQKSQELESHIDELQSTNIELSGQNKSLLDKERQANEEIASLKHELDDQLELVKDFEQKIQHSNEREQLLRSQHTETIENLDNQIKEFELLLEQKRDQLSSLEKNLDQTQTKLKEQVQYHEQDQAELTKVQQTCSTLESQVKELQDNKQVLSKKLEKETKEKQALTENLKELSNDIPKLIESQQQLEEKLKQTKKELELINQKYLLATDDTQRERTKWERTWKELEETVKLNQQLQTEKRELESSQKYSSEMSQLKYMNKVTMLEKKCDYLKRMNTLDAKNAVTETQNQLFDLMAEHEKLTSVFQDLESILVEKEKQVEQFSQKLLQVDDLLTQQHKQSVEQQPNKTVKNNIILEKCIDEILLECTITGVIPSKLNAREKTTLVIEKIHDYVKELTNAIMERDQYKTKLDSITRDLSTTHDIQFRCVEKMIGDVRMQLGEKLEFNSLLTNIEQQLKLVQLKMNNKPTTSELEVQTDEDERLLELQEKYERAKATCIQLKDVVRKFTVMQQENLKPPSPIQKAVSPVRSIPSPVQSTASTPPSTGKKDTSYKGIHKKPVPKNKPK